VPSLAALAREHDVVAVVTQPERPAGRGLAMRPTPVMERARALGLEVSAPPRLDGEVVERLASLRPRVLACVSYGKILPHALLTIDGMTPLNLHPSLLPRYRGATPIQAALRDGVSRTGVTVIWMSDEMDAGDIAAQASVDIAPDDDFGVLHDRLALVGAQLLLECVGKAATGSLPRAKQEEALVTYTKPIRKDDLQLHESMTAEAAVNLVRSASPVPGAWTIIAGKRVKVLAARADAATAPAIAADGMSVAVSDGRVRLLRVVPEGKREMTGADFVRTLRAAP
jgi:methionyl-tRNA formyltransferase